MTSYDQECDMTKVVQIYRFKQMSEMGNGAQKDHIYSIITSNYHTHCWCLVEEPFSGHWYGEWEVFSVSRVTPSTDHPLAPSVGLPQSSCACKLSNWNVHQSLRTCRTRAIRFRLSYATPPVRLAGALGCVDESSKVKCALKRCALTESFVGFTSICHANGFQIGLPIWTNRRGSFGQNSTWKTDDTKTKECHAGQQGVSFLLFYMSITQFYTFYRQTKHSWAEGS